MSKQTLLVAGLGAYALLLYTTTLKLSMAGHVFWVVLAAWLASPLLLLVLRITMEDGMPAGLFSPKTQSWAFMFGDTVFLTFAFIVVTIGHRRISGHDWYQQWWWVGACFGVGMLGGYVFHYLDTSVYMDAGAGLALNSPTKLAHDFVAYPVLLGGLLCLGVPVVLYEFKWVGALFFVGLLGWGLMGARDAKAGLAPTKLHPNWSSTQFEVVTR